MQSMGAGEEDAIGEVQEMRARAAKFERVSGVAARPDEAKHVRAAVRPESRETTTKTGIDVLGDVSWGTHWCLFYQSKQDLIDILVPYFKVGLENNEFCMWIACEPLNAEEARRALSQAVGNLDDCLDRGQIEILDYNQWYTKSGMFDADTVLRGWAEKKNFAAKNGFDGMRLTGNSFWLEEEDWKEFADYEQVVDGIVARERMLAVCTYSLGQCGAAEILDVVSNHDFALIKRQDKWDVVEKSTRRKHAEEALRQSEEKFRLAMETTSDGMWDWNIAKSEVYRNDRLSTMLGYEPHELPASQEEWEKRIHPEDKMRVLKASEDHLAGKSDSFEVECRVRVKSGDYIWVLARGKVVAYGEDGAPLRMVGTSIDITSRKKAADALRESEQKYRTLVEQSVMGVAIAQGNPPGLVFVNRAMAEITGYCVDELTSLSPEQFADLIHSEDRATFFGRLKDRWLGKELSQNWHFRTVRKGREVRWLQLSCRLVTFNGRSAVQACFQDVTEQKEAEEKLGQESLIRDKLLDKLPGIAMTIKKGTREIVASNEAARKVGAVPGKTCYKTCSGRDSSCPWCLAPEVWATDEPRRVQVEYKGTHYEGIWSPLNDDLYVHYILDVTHHKKTEARLVENQKKLKAMASRILRAEDRERQRIAVGLHDDICQKLVLTKLTLESSLSSIPDPDVAKSVEIACGAIGEAIEDADSLTFALSNPVLRELGFVAALKRYLSEEIRQKHRIEYEFENDGQSGDLPDEIKTCLFRVTRELLTNVVKHANARTIIAAIHKSDCSICVIIEDDGVGFEVAKAGSENSRTSRFGLFSVREQLEHLGGRLEIESGPGGGTIAAVFLPLGKKTSI